MEPTVVFVVVLLVVAAVDALVRQFAPHNGAFRLGSPAHPRASRGRKPLSARLLRRVYHYRNLLVGPPLVFALFCFHMETEDDWLIWPVGSSVVVLGVALRVWAQAHIRFRLGLRRHLTTTGPYAIIRNPLYVANTVICIGATIASELVWLIPITLAWCIAVYSVVVRQEEARLLGKYGEAYREYRAAVPRWVPRTLRLSNLGAAAGYLRSALTVELPCLLILLPFVAKEFVSPWFEH